MNSQVVLKLMSPMLLLAGAGVAQAESLLFGAGVNCRPSTAADVPKLDYRDGAASNVHAAPGTAAQNASVTCALPPVPQSRTMTEVAVAFYDTDQRWSKCYFYSLYPGSPHAVLTTSVPGSPHLGQAILDVDSSSFMPYSVRCTVRPGQMLYAVQVRIEPWP